MKIALTIIASLLMGAVAGGLIVSGITERAAKDDFLLGRAIEAETSLQIIEHIENENYHLAVRRLEGGLYLSKLFFDDCDPSYCSSESIPEVAKAHAKIRDYEFRYLSK